MLPTGYIESIEFSIYNDDDIIKDAAVQLTNKESHKATRPVRKGIHDAGMGTTDYSYNCDTCQNTKDDCPGHLGIIKLNYPVIQPTLRDEVVRWLKIICFECGNVLTVPEGSLTKVSFNDLVKKIGTKNTDDDVVCINCKGRHPHVIKSKTDDISINVEFFKSKKVVEIEKQLLNHQIKAIFERVKDSIVIILRRDIKNHPRNLIWTTLPVLPNTSRPNVKSSSGKNDEDDTTNMIRDIIKHNNALGTEEIAETSMNFRERIKIPKNRISDYNTLSMLIFTMISGSSAKGKMRIIISNNNTIKSIKKKFTGKPGMIRRGQLGKRTNRTGRSVITGDPTLPLDILGVPVEMAAKLYKEEVVHDFNIARLNIAYKNGSNKYPGAIILKRDKRTYKVDAINDKQPLRPGDILIRMIVDGDIINFNRQPTLTESSISSLIVKVKGSLNNIISVNQKLSDSSNSRQISRYYREVANSKTLSFNPTICILFNADFDGDAMNVILPSTAETSVETEMLSSVHNWSIGWKNSNAIIGGFHDCLAGAYEITQLDVKINKYNAMLLFGPVAKDSYDFNKQEYSGRDIVQFLLNKYDVNYRTRLSSYKENWHKFVNYQETELVIEKGKYISGVLDQKSIGQGSKGSLIHTIYSKYGPKEAFDFVYRLQRVVDKFMSVQGFTFSLRDITLSKETVRKLKIITDNMIADSYQITQRLNEGKIIPPIGTTIEEQYEEEQRNAISPGDDYNNIVLQDLDFKNNNFVKLILSGAKGNLTHFINITSAVGSQEINGSRMLENFGHKRSLPYFRRFDEDPISRGLVVNSYNDGLMVHELIFNSMTGRYALVNRSLGTAETGHKNRETVKNLESIIIDYLRSCSKNGRIIQIAFGDTAMDNRCLEEVNFPTVMLSDKKLEEQYHTKASALGKFNNKNVQALLDAEFQKIKDDRDMFRSTFFRIESHHSEKFLLSNKIYMCFNVKRIIFDMTQTMGKGKLEDPVKAMKMVEDFCENLPYIYYNQNQQKKKLKLLPHDRTKTFTAEILIRSHLCISNLIKEGVNLQVLEAILREIRTTMNKSLIGYGRAVGILSSQSICEPMTQFILDSHHRAGMAGTKTTFIKRIRELYTSANKNSMENPSMTLYVKPEYEKNKNEVIRIGNYIEMVQFKSFVTGNGYIFFEKFGHPIHPEYKHEKAMIDDFVKNNPNNKVPANLTNWCIRYEINKFAMISKNMDLMTIIVKLRSNKHLFVVHNQKHSDKIIIRIYIRNTYSSKNFINIDMVNDLNSSLMDLPIRGVDGISRAYVVKVMRTKLDDDNGIADDKEEIYAIKTAGINFEEILFNPYIDTNNVHCDSVADTQYIYGVQAARNKLINEIRETIPGVAVSNYSILADEVMSTGIASKINSYGITERDPHNSLLQISDSRPAQVLQRAALSGVKEKIAGISAPIMIGTTPKHGSLYSTIAINETLIKNNVITLDSILDDI
jgi:DNA-directed RNA polymerase beta' subunit